MILADINWLSISIAILLLIFVIVCLLMTLIILMQRPKQEGLGAAFGGGVTDQVFGARTTNVLQKGTAWLAGLFFLISLILSLLIAAQNRRASLLDQPAEVGTSEQSKETDVAVEPTTPTEEALKDRRSLADELQNIHPAPVTLPGVINEAPPESDGADSVDSGSPDQAPEAEKNSLAPDQNAAEETPEPPLEESSEPDSNDKTNGEATTDSEETNLEEN